MKRHITAAIALAAMIFSVDASAQNRLDASVSVDGKYLPEIIRTDRINRFPKSVEFTLPAMIPGYEFSGVSADFNPGGPLLPATGWRSTRLIGRSLGYVDLSLGSWLNSNLSAGVNAIRRDDMRLGFRLQYNSTSLWRPEYSFGDYTAKGDQRKRYDGLLGVDFSKKFGDAGVFNADLQYHLGYFNYYGIAPVWDATAGVAEEVNAPTQTVNDIALRLLWSAEKGRGELNWDAGASLRYFGYRSAYDNLGDWGSGVVAAPTGWGEYKGSRETDIRLHGGVSMPWDNGSAIGADAELAVLCYSGAPVDNYGQFTLTPYYAYNKGTFFARVGAKVNLTFNAGEKGNRYSAFHIAPDCRLGVRAYRMGFYLDVKGGSELQTLASLSDLDYYQNPVMQTTRPVYSPLDAAMGLNFGPFSGFSASVHAGYKITKHQTLGGYYMMYLQSGLNPDADNAVGMNMHGVTVGAELKYEPSRVVGIRLSGSYQPQRGECGYFNGYDRPRGIVGADLTLKPWKGLRVNAAYSLRTHRALYIAHTAINQLPQPDANGNIVNIGGSLTETTYSRIPLKNMSLLGVAVGYDISERFGFGVQADNLLNRKTDILPYLPGEGISISGNLHFTF